VAFGITTFSRKPAYQPVTWGYGPPVCCRAPCAKPVTAAPASLPIQAGSDSFSRPCVSHT
jgi:hypothetical protein